MKAAQRLRYGQPSALLLVDRRPLQAASATAAVPRWADECLRRHRAAAAQLRRRATADWWRRYGGEEFALLLPHTDRAGAMALAR